MTWVYVLTSQDLEPTYEAEGANELGALWIEVFSHVLQAFKKAEKIAGHDEWETSMSSEGAGLLGTLIKQNSDDEPGLVLMVFRREVQ